MRMNFRFFRSELYLELVVALRSKSVATSRQELETVMVSSVEFDSGWH